MIYGKLNTADMHTKPLRSFEFLAMANKILGRLPPPLPTTPLDKSPETVSYSDMAVEGQSSTETKRSLPPDPATTINAKRRKAHILRYITRSTSDSPMGADVDVLAL